MRYAYCHRQVCLRLYPVPLHSVYQHRTALAHCGRCSGPWSIILWCPVAAEMMHGLSEPVRILFYRDGPLIVCPTTMFHPSALASQLLPPCCRHKTGNTHALSQDRHTKPLHLNSTGGIRWMAVFAKSLNLLQGKFYRCVDVTVTENRWTSALCLQLQIHWPDQSSVAG